MAARKRTISYRKLTKEEAHQVLYNLIEWEGLDKTLQLLAIASNTVSNDIHRSLQDDLRRGQISDAWVNADAKRARDFRDAAEKLLLLSHDATIRRAKV